MAPNFHIHETSPLLSQFQEVVNENIQKRIQNDFGKNQVATESINFMQTEVSLLRNRFSTMS